MKVQELMEWVADVHAKWTPPAGLFTRSASAIASALHSKSKDLKQAMSRLNFYINRAGSKLSAEDKSRLDAAKSMLRTKFSKK